MPGADFEVPVDFGVERGDVSEGFAVPAATPVGITISMTPEAPDPDRFTSALAAIDEVNDWARGTA